MLPPILRIDQIFTYNCLITMYKVKSNMLPISIINLFPPIQHSHFTRHAQGNYHQSRPITNFGKSSPVYTCNTLWSSLAQDIKNVNCITTFKRLIKDILNYNDE